MIALSLTELAFWVIGVALILVIVGAWGAHWASAKEERRSVRDRAVCRLCLAVFETPGRERTLECPECGAKTDRQGPTPLG